MSFVRDVPSKGLVAGLVLAAALALLLYIAPDVLLIGFAGLLFSLFLRGGADALTRWTGLSPGWALLAFILAILAAFALVGLFAAPVIADQADQLAEQVPRAARALRERIERHAWSRSLLEQAKPERLLSAGGAIAGPATAAIAATFGALGNLAIIMVLGLFLATDPATYAKGIRTLFPPARRPRADAVMGEVARVLRGWLLAQLLAMAVIGALTAAGLWLLGLPLAVALGVIAALMTFVPNLGPIMAAAPAVLLGLADGPLLALWVGLLYVGVQVIEGNVTTPLIQQHTIALPPALTIAAQLLMGVLFGILGLALAVPLTAAAITLTRTLYVEGYLEEGAGASGRETGG